MLNKFNLKTSISVLLTLIVMIGGVVFANTHDTMTVNTYIKTYPHCRNKVSLLFIQHAAAASLEPLKSNNHCYNLSLSGVKQGVLYFSDQPKRMVGQINNEDFVNIWKHNTVKPNMVLQGYYKGGNTNIEFNDVLDISRPYYDAKTTHMSYQACLLNNKEDKLKIVPMINVTLFIDNFHPWP